MTIFTVNNTFDPGDGKCASNGNCTLRDAILAANNNPNVGGPDLIRFNIPGSSVHTIKPSSPLPSITDPLTIDGYTQGAFTSDPATLSGSLCTNDILFPGIEMVSPSPGRSTIPLPSVATMYIPFSHLAWRDCGHTSAFCHAVKFRGFRFPRGLLKRYALGTRVNKGKKEGQGL